MTSAFLATAAVAPLLAEPSLRSEQVSQLVLGTVVDAVEARGEWQRVHTRHDQYAGWTHRGYLHACSGDEADRWEREAAWSDGAVLTLDPGLSFTLPVGARARITADGTVTLPDGRLGQIRAGAVRPREEYTAVAQRSSVADWIMDRFGGAPYLWGGMTPAGVDCSGLVQVAFMARGVRIARDARAQVADGVEAPLADRLPGDLLFFRDEDSGAITHVAVQGREGALCHAALSRGGVVLEPTGPGTAGAALLQRLVAVRRIPGAH